MKVVEVYIVIYDGDLIKLYKTDKDLYYIYTYSMMGDYIGL